MQGEKVGRARACRRAPWLAALVGRRTRLPDYTHFPADDLVDRRTGAQLFLHAHDTATHGFAHVHCFMRVRNARRDALTHIAAITLDADGWPDALIAVNQWVTGDWWQPAPRTLALADRFEFGARSPARPFAAMLRVFRPELELLLERRDARLQRLLDRYPARNVLTDRRIEIVASLRVDRSAAQAAL